MNIRARGVWIGLLVMACLGVYLAGNGGVALWDRDEPRYAMASRWMLEQGDWIVPRIGWGENPDTPRTAKPVMVYWLQATAMAVFGVGAFAARFPSAIAMTGVLAVMGAVIGRFVGMRRAMWTVLVLGSSAMVVVAAKMCVTDAVLLLFVTIAQLCLAGIYLLSLASRKSNPLFGYSGGGLGRGRVGEGDPPSPQISPPALELGVDDNLSDARDHSPSPAYSRERAGERAVQRRAGKALSPTLSRRTGRGGKSTPQLQELRFEENSNPGTGERGRERMAGVDRLIPVWLPIVMWIAIGLAGLTKGPVVVGVQVMTMIVLAGLEVGGRWRERAAWREAIGWWRLTRPVMGLAIVAVICGPWLIALHWRAPDFLPTIIGHDVIRRSTQALEGHKGPPGFYLLTLFGTFFPWSLLLPLTFMLAWKNRRLPQTRFALAAVIGPWIMMELVATKLVHYVLPIFPPLAYLAGDAIVRCLRGQYPDLRNKAAVIGTAVWSWVVMGFAIGPWVAWYWFAEFPYWQTILLSGAAMIWSIGVFVLMKKRRPALAMAGMGGGMLVVMLIAFGIYLPAAGWFHLAPRAARVLVKDGASERGEVMMLGYKEQSLAFYQGGTIREEKNSDYLLITPPADWPRWIVLPWDQWKRLPESYQAKFEILAGFDGINIAKGDYLHLVVLRKKEFLATDGAQIGTD